MHEPFGFDQPPKPTPKPAQPRQSFDDRRSGRERRGLSTRRQLPDRRSGLDRRIGGRPVLAVPRTSLEEYRGSEDRRLGPRRRVPDRRTGFDRRRYTARRDAAGEVMV